MRLSSARILLVNLNDNQEEFAKYTFTKPIQTLNDNPSGFHVVGYQSSASVDGESVRLDQNDQRSVIVGFPAGTDLQAYTAATTDSDVVQTIDLHANVQDAVHLQGGGHGVTAGLTSAPELVSISQNRSLNQIQYTMDQFLDENSGSASAIGYYTSDGRMHTASSIVSTFNRNIIAQFDASNGDRVENAVRYFVLENAATSKQGQDTITGSLGGATAAPDLSSVATVGTSRTQWLYTFDEPIRNVDPSMFHVYTGDGTKYDATSATIRGTSQVLASFPDVREFKGQVRVATVDSNAVLALVGSDLSNTVGSASVATTSTTNLTSGPDLTSASRDTSSGQVTFHFDTRLDDSSIPDPGNFAVITTSGSVVPGTNVVDISRDAGTVIVQFDNAAVETAAGVIVNADAVTDFQGSGNIADALAAGSGSTLTATLGAAQNPNGTNALGVTTGTPNTGTVTQLLPSTCTPNANGCG